MSESYYQSKIIKAIEKMGGWVINGNYSKAGEPDLQCGYPIDGRLYYLAVEVKTEKDYHRVMRGVKEIDGRYEIINSKTLKKHESLQIHKINAIRDKGGLALIAYDINQIYDYC